MTGNQILLLAVVTGLYFISAYTYDFGDFDHSIMNVFRIRMVLALCLFLTGISQTRLIKTFNSFSYMGRQPWKSYHKVDKVEPNGILIIKIF